jgi:hypothetical protein
MSRVWTRIFGGVAIVEGNFIEIANFEEPARNGLDMLANVLECNVDAGGFDDTIGIDASATGDVTLKNAKALYFDNTSSQWTGSAATKVARYRYRIRNSRAGMEFTPKLWYAATEAALETAPVPAAISGEEVCSATDADYSGDGQLQTVSFTIPAGAKFWKAGGTIGGSPTSGDQVFASALRDIFISTMP